MKILIDTIYLLQQWELLEKLFSSSHSFLINELSLFELFGKASRFMPEGKESQCR
jgi:hypothetical protein